MNMTKLFIGQLPFSISSDDLKALFEEIGPVDDAFVVQDRDTRRSKGFGFISASDDVAQKMIAEMNGKDVEGRALTVNVAQEKTDKPRTGGFGGGNGGGGYNGGGGGSRGNGGGRSNDRRSGGGGGSRGGQSDSGRRY
jgi:cold-inducible RNA-binding protein